MPEPNSPFCRDHSLEEPATPWVCDFVLGLMVCIGIAFLLNGCATPAPAVMESITVYPDGSAVIPIVYTSSLEAQRDAKQHAESFFANGWEPKHTLWTVLIGGLVMAGYLHERRKPKGQQTCTR